MSKPVSLLIAPNAFKNSLSAGEAAMAIERGFMQSKLNCHCEIFPVGDGGDGTGFLLVKQAGGHWADTDAHDALGRKIRTSFGLINNDQAAVIEMAAASGIGLLKANELNPLRASSYGTGQLIKAALDKGVKKIILTLGGSATVDGGIGILNALGFRFFDKSRMPLDPIPDHLTELAFLNDAALDKRISACELIVLCDVNNRLLGEEGAAAVFGPQKGASPDDVKKLDSGLAQFAKVVMAFNGKDMAEIKHGGTAGGVAAGLFALLNARLVNGIDYFLDQAGFGKLLKKADIVITGEGSIDDQTLQGKGPFGVALRASEEGLPVIGLAGKLPSQPGEYLRKYFDVLLTIGQGPVDIAAALQSTAIDLQRTAYNLGNLIAMGELGVDRKE